MGIAGLTFSPPKRRGCRAAPGHTRQCRILPRRSGSRRRSATLARVGWGSRCALRRWGTSPVRWPPRVPDNPCRTPPVEDRRIEVLVVRSVEPVDNLTFDIRVKDHDLDAQFLGVAANALVVFG